MFSWFTKRFSKSFILFGHGTSSSVRQTSVLHPYIQKIHMMILILKFFGYRFISAEQLLDIANKNFEDHNGWIHLTFDDGYQSNLTILYPLLKKYNIPFSVYISSAHIQNNNHFFTYKIHTAVKHTKNFELLKKLEQKYKCNEVEFKYKLKNGSKDFQVELIQDIEKLLSFDEWIQYNKLYENDSLLNEKDVFELSHKGVYIGSHNDSHIVLNRNVKLEDVEYEMRISKKKIEAMINRECLIYAYPNGTKRDFSPETATICKSLGYKVGLTTVYGFIGNTSNNMLLPRIQIVTLKSLIKTILYSFLR